MAIVGHPGRIGRCRRVVGAVRRYVPSLATGFSHRPGWLREGALRLLAVCFALLVLGMLSPRIDPDDAGRIVFFGAVIAGACVAGFVVLTRRTIQRLDIPYLSAGAVRAEGILLALRQVGILLLALAFFVFWTFVYIGVWWYRPESAFRGLSRPDPYLSEFFYYAVSTAFVSPPATSSPTAAARARPR